MSTTRSKQRTNGKPESLESTAIEDRREVEEAAVVISIQRIEVERLLVPIIGTSPLITHRFSEKAKRQMLDAMQGRKTPKQPKDPEAEYLAAFYRFEDGTAGMPAVAFKKASVGAARFYGKDVPMTELRQFMFFTGEIGVDGIQLVRVGGDAQMREDVVKIGKNGADLRYRPEFREWTTTLDVTYVKSSLTRDSVLSLIDAAGMGVGVGEWRPEKNGDFGCFQIASDADVRVVEVKR